MRPEPLNRWYFEYLDNIANLELKNKPAQQGGTALRYRVAREQQGGTAITEQIAKAVGARLHEGTVLLVTGTGNPQWLPRGETDGPSGVAVLARLFAALGVRSCVLSEERFLPGIASAVQAGGTPLLEEEAWSHRKNAALMRAFPTGAAAAGPFIDRLLSGLPNVCAAFFVEKPGPNAKGVFHNSSGKPKSADWVAHAHRLVDVLRERGVPTVGVGDGGNEIGFGRIAQQLADAHPLGRDCGCPCHGGLLDNTAVDYLLPSAVSNWGAYAIACAIALASGRAGLMPAWTQVRQSIEAPIRHGAFDGYTGLALPSVDATSAAANQAIYQLMLEVLRLACDESQTT